MGAPTNAHIKYYRGTNATPTNDTDDIIGAIHTSAEISESTSNLLFDGTPANPLVGDANITHYNGAYRKNEEGASGKCVAGCIFITNAIEQPTSAGIITLTATATSVAAGHKAKVTFINNSGSVVTSETLTLANGTVSTGASAKANEHVRIELLNSAGTAAVAALEDILVSRSTNLGIIPLGAYHATTEYELACASSKNATITASDRLTAPTGITAFSRARKFTWSGTQTNSSIATPTPINDTDYFGYVLKKTLRAGFPSPVLGYIDCRVNFQFSAQA